MNDRTYCSNYQDCSLSDLCERASWPKGSILSMADFFEEQNYQCEAFLCNCSKTKFVGSNKHGNYGKCPVCGEEGEI